MATRFYFSEDLAAPVSPPAPGAEWEHVNSGVTRKALIAPDGSALTTTAYTPDAADDLTDRDSLHRQYVSDPLAAQTIGVQGITAQFQCSEANAANNLFLTVVLKVISNDGTTVRATILAITRDASTEISTTLTNRDFPSVNTSSYTCVAGDRILIEVGVGGLCTAAGGVQGHNASLRFGCSASGGDLPADDTDTTTTKRPWLEFANTLAFQQPAGAAALASVQQPKLRPSVALGSLYSRMVAPPAVAMPRAASFSLPQRWAWRPPEFVFQTLLLTTLAVVVAAVPFVASAQDLPRRPAVPAQTWTQNLLQGTLATPTAAPFFQTDWPLPRAAVPATTLKTWIDAVRLNLLGQDAIFGAPGQTTAYDWPNPRLPVPSIALRTWLDNRLLDTLAFVQPRPFAQLDWPVPRTAIPAVVLRTWIDTVRLNLLGRDTFFGAPGQPPTYAWPLPSSIRRAPDLFTFLNLLESTLGSAAPAPFAQLHWPNPIGRIVLPLDLRTVNLLENTLGVAPLPFAMLDWPNPRIAASPVVLRTWLDALKLNLLGKDKFFGAPGQVPTYPPAPPPRNRIVPPQSWLQSTPAGMFPTFVPAGLILITGESAVIPTASGEGFIVVTATGEIFFIPTAGGESSITGSGG